jgi:hypothetical protein
MLTELKSAHDDLLSGLTAMDAVTSEPLAERHKHSNARWRLSQGGLKTTIALRTIFAFLKPRVSEAEAAAIRTLQAAEMKLLRHSSTHVGKWAIAGIEADWPGYCSDYRAFRSILMASISAEKRILYVLADIVDASRAAVHPQCFDNEWHERVSIKHRYSTA